MSAFALPLVLDASALISPREWRLQAEGHAAAIRRQVMLELAQAGLR